MVEDTDLPVMIHTPHRNKKQGTSRSMDVIEEHGIAPSRVVIDHNNEETVQEVLDRGYWAAFTIYPKTKMGNERMVEVVRKFGSERIIVDSSCDWGVSDPLSLVKVVDYMGQDGHEESTIQDLVYNVDEGAGLRLVRRRPLLFLPFWTFMARSWWPMPRPITSGLFKLGEGLVRIPGLGALSDYKLLSFVKEPA